MERPKPKLTENKTLMLYAIDLLGGLTNAQALRFFLENDLMDYIDIQLSLAELHEYGLLYAESMPLGITYNLTQLGKQSIEYFGYRVPDSRRRKVAQLAEQWKPVFQEETQVFSNYVKTFTGDIMVRLAVRESDALQFELNLVAPTNKTAELFCKNWKQYSSEIYGKVLEVLSRPEAPAQDGGSLDDRPAASS